MKIFEVTSEKIFNIQIIDSDETFNFVRDSNGNWSYWVGDSIEMLYDSAEYEQLFQEFI